MKLWGSSKKEKHKEDKSIDDLSKILADEVKKELLEKPPCIGVVGVSGTGKSTTLNSMFRTNLPTSQNIRCTTEFSITDVGVALQRGKAVGHKTKIQVVDAPGLGEDIEKDPEYLKMYRDNLGKCDVIIWVMTARNRAIALDQMYLQKLTEFHSKMIFAINQVDLVDVVDWDDGNNLPSEIQLKNIEIIENDKKKRIESILKKPIDIIGYSASRHYRLMNLFELIIKNISHERRWMFEMLRTASAEDWLNQATNLNDEQRKEILEKHS